MCDTCESNEILITILRERIRWIEEVLNILTSGNSGKYLEISNDLQIAWKRNISRDSIGVLMEEKKNIEKQLK